MKMLQRFAFFVMMALVPAIAIAQSASGISAKVEKVDKSADKVTLDHAAIPGGHAGNDHGLQSSGPEDAQVRQSGR